MIPRLQEFADINKDELGYGHQKSFTITASNIDEVFYLLGKMKIPEVEVDRMEMYMISAMMVYGATGTKFEGQLTQTEAWKAQREGKVDKYLGVKLKLI